MAMEETRTQADGARDGVRLIMSSRARRLALVLALLVGIATPVAVAAAPEDDPGYTVRSGDTISGIANRLHVPGGWDALYVTNRSTIGSDPDRLRIGMHLRIPSSPPQPAVATPEGDYVVRSGDTLTTIAHELAVRGGRDALYAANRERIGSDANRLEVGTRLEVPGARAPLTSSTRGVPSAPSGEATPQGEGAVAGDRVAAAPSRTSSQGGPPVRSLIGGGGLLLVVLLVASRWKSRRWRTRPGSTAYPMEPARTRPEAFLPGRWEDAGDVRVVDRSTPLTKSTRTSREP